MTINNHRFDVLVAGAGIAGLVCARALVRRGVDAAVLEARDRVGGRTGLIDIDGHTIDLGGQFLGPGQDRVYALARELGLRVVKTHTAGEHLIETAPGRIRRWRGDVPRLGIASLLDLGQALCRFERLAETVDPEAPWSGRDAELLDGQTLAGWIRRRLHTADGRRVFTLACRITWACEPSELSLLHALFYARSAGSLRAVMATDGGAQQDRLEGGAGELARRLAGQLDGRVLLGATVTRIAQDESGVAVTVHSGQTIRAGQVVVAIPPTLAGRIAYDPPLPAARDGLTQRLPMGSAVKLAVVYPEPFWRAGGLSGLALSLTGPLPGVVDSSPTDGSRGILVGVLTGAAPGRQAILEELVRLFGPAAAEPVGYVEHDWAAEPFTRGAYSAVFPPGAWTRFGRALRPPIGRIHWAGSETATRWYGYIEGAIRSGETAADEISR